MTGIEPGWQAPPEQRDRQSFRGDPRAELARYLAATTVDGRPPIGTSRD
jgi:cytochrome c-type protein NapC